jgi:hypothetical protein
MRRMSDLRGGATVYLVAAETATGSEANQGFPDATRIEVHDGHLWVISNARGIIGLYAPGTWHHARLNDK